MNVIKASYNMDELLGTLHCFRNLYNAHLKNIHIVCIFEPQ